MCTMVLKETLSYFANNGESVFCTFIDATKAFDKINYIKLFKLLVHRMLPPVISRLLLNMYTKNVYRVSRNEVCSIPLSVLNEVKQTVELSALYFFVFI